MTEEPDGIEQDLQEAIDQAIEFVAGREEERASPPPEDADTPAEPEGPAAADEPEVAEEPVAHEEKPLPPAPPPPLPLPTTRLGPSRRPTTMVVVVVLGALGAAAYFTLLAPRALSIRDQETDLRWAVEQVVREVESFRREQGRLPVEEELYGLLSEVVTYVPRDYGYGVIADNGTVRVEYDGLDSPDQGSAGADTADGGGEGRLP